MKNPSFTFMKFLSNPELITHLEAQKNYSHIHFADGTSKVVGYNLKKFEEYFNSNESFARVHKSYIVNKNFISKVSDDGMRLNLTNKKVIPVNNKLVTI